MPEPEVTPTTPTEPDEWGNTPEPVEEATEPATPAVTDAAPVETPAPPQFDPEVVARVMDEKLAAVKDEIVNAVRPPEPEPTTEDTSWKPEKWDDFTDHAKDVYKQMREQERSEEERIKTEAKAEEDRINSAFDGMVTELEKDGFLPAVEDATNADDPGRKARAELYGYAAKLGTLDLKAAGTQLAELHESGFSYDPRVGKLIRSNPKPAGADSPVGSSSRTTAPSRKRVDIHSMDWDELTRRARDDYSSR